VWSTSDRNSAISNFLHNFGFHFPSTTKLPDLNFVPRRLCARGASLPVISWLSTSTISLDDLKTIVGHGADPFARGVLPLPSADASDLEGNMFTYALLEPRRDQPFQLLFQAKDAQGMTFYERSLAEVGAEARNISVCPIGEPSILHVVSKYFDAQCTPSSASCCVTCLFGGFFGGFFFFFFGFLVFLVFCWYVVH
jgi:hypothetical protein